MITHIRAPYFKHICSSHVMFTYMSQESEPHILLQTYVCTYMIAHMSLKDKQFMVSIYVHTYMCTRAHIYVHTYMCIHILSSVYVN